MAVCLVFVVPADALDYTGWDFDFSVQPAVIDLGQTVNVSVHTYYYGNDSHGKPFEADAPGVTVTINSEYFNTIELADGNGWLINADHPDVPGNYTYTAKVIFRAEEKIKSVTLVVHPAGTATTVPVSGSPSPVVPTPAVGRQTNATDNLTDVESDQINMSNLEQPLLSGVTNNGTGAPTDNPYVVVPASASPAVTPAPTKTPSVLMSITGTVTVLIITGFLARRKQ